MSGPLGSAQWMYASGAEVVQQSLKFNDDESQYLRWTPAAAGNRKTWTWSAWLKRSGLSTIQQLFCSTAGDYNLRFHTDNTIIFEGAFGTNTSAAVFRDVSAFYHIVAVHDTTESTSSDRFKLYVNGVQQTTSGAYPSGDGIINNTVEHGIGGQSGINFFDGYLSNIHFIDGQALGPTSFGQFTNGYWEKKDYAGAYGTNGFHLTFQDDVVSEGFNAVTYRGNGGTQSISGLGLNEPDLVWIKMRNAAGAHFLYDTVRGATKGIHSNLTDAETTYTDGLTSFDADGFTVGSRSNHNGSGNSYVAWAWDAGSGSPVSNTQGSITSTVKANPAYGFSIGTFTKGSGTETFGHGLSSAPELLILKRRDSTGSWFSYSSVTGATKWIRLNGTDAATTDSTFWNNTAPTSSVATISTAYNSGEQLVFYAWNSVAGYSSIGSYSGSGISGNSITGLGFSPAWLMIKSSAGAANDWFIYDNTRQPTNPKDLELYANLSSAEYDSGRNVTFTNDGFDLDTVNYVNNSGVTYIYMAFADTREAAFWKDVSGNNNNWTPNNLDYRDSVVDSPANNFAVLNPLDINSSGGMTLSEGNLKLTSTNAGSAFCSFSNIALENGSWYSEVYINGQTGGYPNVGIGDLSKSPTANEGIFAVKGVGYAADGNVYRDGGTIIDTVSSFTTGDVIGIAYDADNQKIYFSKNGTWQNSADPAAGTNGYTVNAPIEGYVFGASIYSPAPITFNFGQDSTFSGTKPMGAYTDDNSIGNFQYAPPAGYLSLCTANLPTPTIIDGSTAFNTVLYTGDGVAIGSGGNSITGVGHSPDFVWIKARSQAYSSHLYDTVRGATEALVSNSTLAESTRSEGLTSFDADGFTVGSQLGENQLNTTFASWNWKAGGAAVSNTAGTITSQVSANTAAGFSIVSYTGNGTAGATVGHGLSSAPDMIIVKPRVNATGWVVGHSSLNSGTNPWQWYLSLEGTAGQATTNLVWNNTAPTSTVFSLGSGTGTNPASTMIAYCFANSDIIKAGSYTGNGSSDGPFVYTGGRVQWLMIKRTDTAADWIIWDDKRNTYNELTKFLYPNLSAAEATGSGVADLLSNGFKLRNAGTANRNASGGTYIYLAIMESPLKVATAR